MLVSITGRPDIMNLKGGNKMVYYTEHGIKQDTQDTIDRYVDHGVPPGDFVKAVLCNDLRESFGRADHENIATMFEIVKYCYNHIPAACWGSHEAYKNWMEMHRNKKE